MMTPSVFVLLTVDHSNRSKSLTLLALFVVVADNQLLKMKQKPSTGHYPKEINLTLLNNKSLLRALICKS